MSKQYHIQWSKCERHFYITQELKYLDKEEEEVEVFETLCFNFSGISEKKLKYLDKEEVEVFRQRPKNN